MSFSSTRNHEDFSENIIFTSKENLFTIKETFSFFKEIVHFSRSRKLLHDSGSFSRVRDRVEMHRAQTSLDDALEECLLFRG
jgi:hypothetical protein